MQVFKVPGMFSQFHGQPIQQVRESGFPAVVAEVKDRWHQRTTEVTHPDVVDADTGCQRVLRRCDPAGQRQATTGAGGRVGFRQRRVTAVLFLVGDRLPGSLQPFVQFGSLLASGGKFLVLLVASGPALFGDVLGQVGLGLAKQRVAMQLCRFQGECRGLVGRRAGQASLVGGDACLQTGQGGPRRLVPLLGRDLVEPGLLEIGNGCPRSSRGLSQQMFRVQGAGADRIELGDRVVGPDREGPRSPGWQAEHELSLTVDPGVEPLATDIQPQLVVTASLDFQRPLSTGGIGCLAVDQPRVLDLGALRVGAEIDALEVVRVEPVEADADRMVGRPADDPQFQRDRKIDRVWPGRQAHLPGTGDVRLDQAALLPGPLTRTRLPEAGTRFGEIIDQERGASDRRDDGGRWGLRGDAGRADGLVRRGEFAQAAIDGRPGLREHSLANRSPGTGVVGCRRQLDRGDTEGPPLQELGDRRDQGVLLVRPLVIAPLEQVGRRVGFGVVGDGHSVLFRIELIGQGIGADLVWLEDSAEPVVVSLRQGIVHVVVTPGTIDCQAEEGLAGVFDCRIEPRVAVEQVVVASQESSRS